ncbi:conserved hypothetical protein [Paraburkholderia phytofirmans PsJN]|uniref:Lipoprotein n=2 Tax=Paraburkholderia phytofirmans TaxID=261302 RepID=B2T119_PARPJ|nr:conserved hypothetical protein [Paraburkholderia phytofirmans PsJN]
MKKQNMNTLKKTLRVVAALAGLALCACGGGSSSGNQGSNPMGWDAKPAWTPAPPGSGGSGSSNNSSTPATGDNTVPVRVDTSTGNVNRLLASIKVCVPGTQGAPQCVTVDNMLVDTGSTGVRISARAIRTLAPVLLTQAGAVDDKIGSAPIAECAPFASGYTWGSVKRADITIGSKTASNIPIQVVSDGAFTTPDDCIAHGGGDLGRSLDVMGVSGILGIDNFAGDSLDALTKAVPGLYYYCPTQNSCVSTRMLASKEVTNPVSAFATDNNGMVIRLPAVPATGQASVLGQLVFGVGTQQNNALPANATVIALDKYGTFRTQYKGQVFNESAIDSGTLGYAFPDNAIPVSVNGLYTPTSTLELTATIEPNNGSSAPLQMPFSIDNANNLLASGNAAFINLGQYFSNSDDNMFLWGLPFFYGRDVYNVIGNAKAGKLVGPFVAF